MGGDDFAPNTELPFWPAHRMRRDEIARAASLRRAAAFRAAFRRFGAALRRAGAASLRRIPPTRRRRPV